MMTEEHLYRVLRMCLKGQLDEPNTETEQELVKSDDAAIGLSEGEQALSFSQRASYNDVVLAAFDNPTPESFPDFSRETSESKELVKSDDAAIGLSEGEQAFSFSQRASYNDVVLAAFDNLAAKVQFPDCSWETRSELQVRDPKDSEKKKVPSPDSSALPAPSTVRPSSVVKVTRRRAGQRGLRRPGRQRCWGHARQLNLLRMILSLRDKILESYESLEARYLQMEGMLLSFLHGQHKIQDHLEQLLARLDREASLDHLEQRLDRLDARMLAIQGAMEQSAPVSILGSP